MKLIFLIAVLFAPGGEQYQDHVQKYDTPAQCEAARADFVKKAQDMLGFGFNARCVTVTFGPST